MLHPGNCGCEACKESAEPLSRNGFGYPAFDTGHDGEEAWDAHLQPNVLFNAGNYDPSTFGRRMSRHAMGKSKFSRAMRSMGQAFVPGTVRPPFPTSAMETSPAPGPISPASSLIPLSSNQTMPTLSFDQAAQVAEAAGYTVNSDGSVNSVPSSISPQTLALGALALFLLL